MNLRNWHRVLTAIVLIVFTDSALAEKANRTTLTHRDSGLYCNLRFTHGRDPKVDGVVNMLTPERASSADAPWSFYVFQFNRPATVADIKLIERMAAAGKKVILRVDIGRLTSEPNVKQMEERLAAMVKGLNVDSLYAIILGEEQVFWNGWTKALGELYHRAKVRWPDLPVYQWWSPMEVPNVRAESGWVALPADGWVIDLYGRRREEFERKLVKTLETGKPVIHIIWSSPDWPDLCGATAWDEGGRHVFEDQLEVCRAFNVPVAHFCTQRPLSREGKESEPIRWGWHSVNPVVREWYSAIELLAANNRRLPDEAIGFRILDKKLFDWAHGTVRVPAESQ